MMPPDAVAWHSLQRAGNNDRPPNARAEIDNSNNC
jgi:hypothetical protein